MTPTAVPGATSCAIAGEHSAPGCRANGNSRCRTCLWHPDAAAIEAAIRPLAGVETEPAGSVDEAVLAAALGVGTLVSNDLVLGRRAANLGVRWLRTADLLILCVKTGTVSQDDGRAVLNALQASGRPTSALLTSYLEEI